MLIQNQLYITSWNPKNREYYESKGYKFTRYRERFEVAFDDIHPQSNLPLKVICDYCGKEYEVAYSAYHKSISKYHKTACLNCVGVKNAEISLSKRQENMYSKIVEICNGMGYVLLTQKHELVNNSSNITYICPTHGVCETTVTSILQGKRCYKCSRILAAENKNKTTLSKRQDDLYNKASKIAGQHGYIIITKKEQIQNNRTEIEYICPKHGKHTMRIANFINGKRCPECVFEQLSEEYRLSKKEVLERVKKCGGKLLNVDEYRSNQLINLKFVCPICGAIFVSSLSNFTQHCGQVCDKCRNVESKGERQIKEFLLNNSINFIQEKRFEDCRDKNPLPFDFYLSRL